MSELEGPAKFQERETRIREKAYELWETEGRPDGQADRHWYCAARDVDRDVERAGEDEVVITHVAADSLQSTQPEGHLAG